MNMTADSQPPFDTALREDTSPFQAHLGYTLRDWRADYACFEMPVAEFMTNRHGIPHGGVYGVLLDTAMGYAGCYTGDPANRRFAMTLSMNVLFISRPKGKLLIGEGWRTGGGQRTYFAESVIHDETGEKIATGTGVFRYRSAG
tara:strand:+ start:1019 stop:1450 length:432 start_codon:yes stop_codon:yes gene_type:complete